MWLLPESLHKGLEKDLSLSQRQDCGRCLRSSQSPSCNRQGLGPEEVHYIREGNIPHFMERNILEGLGVSNGL